MFRTNLNMSIRMQQPPQQTYNMQSVPAPSPAPVVLVNPPTPSPPISMKPMFQFNNHIEKLQISLPATVVRPTHVNMMSTHMAQLSVPNRFSAPSPPVTYTSKDLEPPANTRARWGNPTWTFFHTIAEKIHPQYFDEIRESMLNIIYTICVNLPCPECAMHAKQFLDSINFQSIQTVDDFRTMLWKFHNTVNAQKGIEIFSFDMLHPTYSNAITVNVVMNFLKVFQERYYNTRNVANDFHRKRAVVMLKQWIRDNLYKFYQ